MSKTTFTLTLDKKLLKEARALCRKMGMDLNAAVTLFLRKMVQERRLPFTPAAETEHCSPHDVKKLLQSCRQVKEGRVVVKTLGELEAMARE